jgi:hypothetical protein
MSGEALMMNELETTDFLTQFFDGHLASGYFSVAEFIEKFNPAYSEYFSRF